MTIALCLSCGAEKWGAFNPCEKCGVGVVESHDLAIAFSDHHLSHDEITTFGLALAALRAQQEKPDNDTDLFVRLFAFLEWITTNRSDILTAHAPEQLRAAVDALVARTVMPAAPAPAPDRGPEA